MSAVKTAREPAGGFWTVDLPHLVLEVASTWWVQCRRWQPRRRWRNVADSLSISASWSPTRRGKYAACHALRNCRRGCGYDAAWRPYRNGGPVGQFFTVVTRSRFSAAMNSTWGLEEGPPLGEAGPCCRSRRTTRQDRAGRGVRRTTERTRGFVRPLNLSCQLLEPRRQSSPPTGGRDRQPLDGVPEFPARPRPSSSGSHRVGLRSTGRRPAVHRWSEGDLNPTPVNRAPAPRRLPFRHFGPRPRPKRGRLRLSDSAESQTALGGGIRSASRPPPRWARRRCTPRHRRRRCRARWGPLAGPPLGVCSSRDTARGRRGRWDLAHRPDLFGADGLG